MRVGRALAPTTTRKCLRWDVLKPNLCSYSWEPRSAFAGAPDVLRDFEGPDPPEAEERESHPQLDADIVPDLA